MNISSEGQNAVTSEGAPAEPTDGGPDFAVQTSYVRTVFLGPDGLRAGWGFAFYVAMFMCCNISFSGGRGRLS